MPNPRKPRALKVLEGTVRKARDHPEPEFPPAEQADIPEWLVNPDAVAAWHRLIPLLQATRVLTEGDLDAIAHLCALHGECVKLWRAGLKPLAADLTQLRLYFTEFGMTPASRSRAGKVGEDSKANPFKNLA